jgi:hypothetical protein
MTDAAAADSKANGNGGGGRGGGGGYGDSDSEDDIFPQSAADGAGTSAAVAAAAPLRASKRSVGCLIPLYDLTNHRPGTRIWDHSVCLVVECPCERSIGIAIAVARYAECGRFGVDCTRRRCPERLRCVLRGRCAVGRV